MYILTIYHLIDDIEIKWQQAASDKRTLEAAAVAWAKENGWEPEDEDLPVEEQFTEVQDWFDNMTEPDDPRMMLRRADA